MGNQNKILLVQVYAGKGIASEFLFRSPSEYKEMLLKSYPEMKEWVKDKIFDQLKDWPNDVNIRLEVEDVNLQGRFLAANIDTPSKVVDKPVNPEILISELEKDSYTHVGFSVISNDYSNFIQCTQAVKKYNSSIKTIAGGPGAMFEQTKDLVDYVCMGERGEIFLRKLFNEEIKRPIKLVITPSRLFWRYGNKELPTELYRIVTKMGCPFSCDFCTTPILYGEQYTGELFSPQQIHDALVEFRDQLKKNKITVYFEEPTSLYKLKWWYEFIDLFREDSGDFAFYVYSITSVLNKLDLDRVSKSAGRIHLVNFGIESFNKNYPKNLKVDFKSLIKRLSDYGIWTNPNYIIGYDFDTKISVWDDIKKMIDLGADANTILHLHPHPMTQIWEKLISEQRLLNVPPEFHYIHGFQSFLHPHFKPGFEDMLPLLCDIYYYIEREIGDKLLNIIQTMKNLLKHTNHPTLFKSEIQLYKSFGKIFYPHWKEFFNPTEVQNACFQNKLK
ncbi:MAG: B12-binding domain-containing radical SAM protein [Candidatus Hermodarchaeota archaeon]